MIRKTSGKLSLILAVVIAAGTLGACGESGELLYHRKGIQVLLLKR